MEKLRALSDDIEDGSQVLKFYGLSGFWTIVDMREWKAVVEDICRSTEDIADRTTSSVKNQNIRKPGQEKAGSLANRNWRLDVNVHKGIVKPNMCSNTTNSMTIPASDIASREFAKERMLLLQSSHGSVTGCKRPLASRQERIKGWDEVVADMKSQATKRKMQELYQKGEMDKRRRTVQVLDPRDLPKIGASHKGPRATTAKARQRRMISQSRVSCV